MGKYRRHFGFAPDIFENPEYGPSPFGAKFGLFAPGPLFSLNLFKNNR